MEQKRDALYITKQSSVNHFEFDEKTADVFSDMARRSIPGYHHIIENIGGFATQFTQQNSCIYDLGCSLGAAAFAIHDALSNPEIEIICVDQSAAMLDKLKQRIATYPSKSAITPHLSDVHDMAFKPTSFVVLNFTLQFIDHAKRADLLKKIHDHLVPGGALVLSEKITFNELSKEKILQNLHHHFKRSQGYSDLEISQKRKALEHVLIPEPAENHIKRLHQVGFTHALQWFQSYNFASFIAIK